MCLHEAIFKLLHFHGVVYSPVLCYFMGQTNFTPLFDIVEVSIKDDRIQSLLETSDFDAAWWLLIAVEHRNTLTHKLSVIVKGMEEGFNMQVSFALFWDFKEF